LRVKKLEKLGHPNNFGKKLQLSPGTSIFTYLQAITRFAFSRF